MEPAAVQGGASAPDRFAGRAREIVTVVALALFASQRNITVHLGSAQLGVMMPGDVVALLLLLVPLGARPLGPPWRRLVLASRALVVAGVVSYLVHPTGFGISALLRLGGWSLVAGVVARWVAERRWIRLLAPLGAAMVVQVIVVLAQYANGDTLGIAWMGERASAIKIVGGTQLAPGHIIGGFRAMPGTTIHPNTVALFGLAVGVLVLAVLLGDLLPRAAADRRVLFASSVVLASCGALIGSSTSRTAVIGVVLAIVPAALLVRRLAGRARRTGLGLGLAFGLPMAAAMVLCRDGWLSRVQQSATTSATQLGSGRMALIRQALRMFGDDPVFGVGPGNYLLRLVADPRMAKIGSETAPVHNIWLYVLASLGVVGCTVFVVLTGLVAWDARRRGLVGALVALPLLVSVGLDVAVTFGSGTLLLAATVGVLAGWDGTSRAVGSRSGSGIVEAG